MNTDALAVAIDLFVYWERFGCFAPGGQNGIEVLDMTVNDADIHVLVTPASWPNLVVTSQPYNRGTTVTYFKDPSDFVAQSGIPIISLGGYTPNAAAQKFVAMGGGLGYVQQAYGGGAGGLGGAGAGAAPCPHVDLEPDDQTRALLQAHFTNSYFDNVQDGVRRLNDLGFRVVKIAGA